MRWAISPAYLGWRPNPSSRGKPGPTLPGPRAAERWIPAFAGMTAELVRERLRVTQEAPVGHAARSLPEPLMRERQGNIPLAGAQGRFRQRPGNDIALRITAADLPEVIHRRQQPLDCRPVFTAMKRRKAFDDRDADTAVEPRRLNLARRRLAHCREPPLDQRFAAGAQFRHRGMNIAKDEAFPIGMPLPQIGQLPPAIADIAAAGLAAQRIEPPQQRRRIRQAQAQRP